MPSPRPSRSERSFEPKFAVTRVEKTVGVEVSECEGGGIDARRKPLGSVERPVTTAQEHADPIGLEIDRHHVGHRVAVQVTDGQRPCISAGIKTPLGCKVTVPNPQQHRHLAHPIARAHKVLHTVVVDNVILTRVCIDRDHEVQHFVAIEVGSRNPPRRKRDLERLSIGKPTIAKTEEHRY
ncbi:MAG: hypothetical protein KatS3mg076_3265 [Candidatus Binatia bacterium]|nr:MAG: hypothetical protein KatS3mg076_3265 [Candidatus Binatia bacterium]